MCGLVGIVAPDYISGTRLGLASDLLKHRGPDGDGYVVIGHEGQLHCHYNVDPPATYIKAHAAIAHRRLAILDQTHNAVQPMCANGVALTYNGEIYNFAELRVELEGMGRSFHSSGDTEVVLQSYLVWGTDCFRRFNGMWSIAIIDSIKRSVVLSRDRFGIKPLYWNISSGVFSFASELAALRSASADSDDYDAGTVARYLCLGQSDAGINTWFKNHKRFPAACWAEIPLDGSTVSVPKFHRFWDMPIPGEHCTAGLVEQSEEFLRLFMNSVSRHLVADVPIGTCLSGGMDSTSIVMCANKHEADRLINDAIGYVADTPELSEAAYMKIAATAGKVNLSEVSVSAEDMISRLPEILAAHDEPFDSPSVIAQWFVFERAKHKGLKVMLDGQGADELLGGYMGYVLLRARDDLLHGRIFEYLNTKKSWSKSSNDFPLSILRILGARFLPRKTVQNIWSRSNQIAAALTQELRGRAMAEWIVNGVKSNTLATCLRDDLSSRILPALLRYEDANSMSHSIEARVPFLDNSLANFCLALSDDFKVKGMERKRILTNAMIGIVPEAIRSRHDKIGFAAQESWLEELLKRSELAFYENRTQMEIEWFDQSKTENILRSPKKHRASCWRIVNAKLWARQLANVPLM